MGLSPWFFERLVLELLKKMGYGGMLEDAHLSIPKTGDGGIDGIIKEDPLGLDSIYIQAKRWNVENTVNVGHIRQFIGALTEGGVKKGVFITTATFTKGALEYSPKNDIRVILIDGKKLSNLLFEYNLGLSISKTYEIKEIDRDYFQDQID